MKRVLLLLLWTFTLELSAQEVIQTSFYGCTLTQTTKTESLIKISQSGANVVSSDISNILFAGKFDAEGADFDYCTIAYDKDTVIAIMFVGSKEKDSEPKISAVKTKYSKLTSTINDYGSLKQIQEVLLTQFGVDSTQIWSRLDDENAIIILDGDSAYAFVYMAYAYIMRAQMNEMADALSEMLGPDYDSANEVKSVAGCSFGDTRSSVTSKFRPKAQSVIDSDTHSVLYSGVSLGGYYFKRGTLYFIADKFVSCSFESEFYTWKLEEAQMMYEGLRAQFARKYTNGHHFDTEKDAMQSYYGMVQKDYLNGNVPPIVVSLKKALSRGGETYYYVTLTYYIARLEDLYNDEI